MLQAIHILAEEKIREAIERGDFDDLPSKGQKLDLSDYFRVPAELRMVTHVLKNSGHVPDEVAREREIQSMQDLIENLEDGQERVRQIRKLNFMIMEQSIRHKRRVDLEHQQYYAKVVERISVRDAGGEDAGGK